MNTTTPRCVQVLLSLLTGLALVLQAEAQVIEVPSPVPIAAILLTTAATCPSGYTDVTATFQGRYLMAKAATGAAGDVLGTAIPTTTTDSSFTPTGTNGTVSFTPAGTIACTDHLAVATAGVTGYCSRLTLPTFTGTPDTIAAQPFTGTPVATMRSTIAPNVSMRLCKKA